MLFIHNLVLASCTYTCHHILVNTELIMDKLEEYKNHFDYLLFNSDVKFLIPPSSPPSPLSPPMSEYIDNEQYIYNHNYYNPIIKNIIGVMITAIVMCFIIYLTCVFFAMCCMNRKQLL